MCGMQCVRSKRGCLALAALTAILLIASLTTPLITRKNNQLASKTASDSPQNYTIVTKDSTEIQSDRLSRIREVCSETKAVARSVQPFRWVIAYEEANVVWCPVFKAASSSWLRFIFQNSRKLSQEKKEERLRTKDPKQPLDLLKDILTRFSDKKSFQGYVDSKHPDSFLLVRHPFSRLVSAYRDKIERSSVKSVYTRDYWYINFGKPAVDKFRAAAKKRFGADFFAAGNNFGSPLPDPAEGTRGKRTEKHPTFWEFVQLLKTQSVVGMNEHWQPVVDLCAVCQIDYKHVFHVENFEENEQIRALLDPRNRSDDVEVEHFNPTVEADQAEKVVEMYFDQLSDADVEYLYELYELDFRLFGYTYHHGEKSQFPNS